VHAKVAELHAGGAAGEPKRMQTKTEMFMEKMEKKTHNFRHSAAKRNIQNSFLKK